MKRKSGSNLFDLEKNFIGNRYEWALVILSPLILFGPMLISGKALFWGTPIMQFVPWREFAFDSLLHGHLPLWNPLLGMGAPLIANYQSAIFYPPNWILILTGIAWGQGLLVMLHVIWTGIGMLLLVKQLGMSRLSQAVAALSFSLSGYLIARAGFLSINATAAWLPWIVMAADRVVVDQSLPGKYKRLIKPIFLLCLLVSLQWLAGHAQTAWYSLIFVLIWVSWRGFSLRRGLGLFQAILALGIALAVAFVLSAIQLLPTVEYLFHSHRASEVERELALVYSFWPWRILGLLMPNLFGNPATGDFWGYANYWEDAIYIGVLPLILSFFACVRGFRKSRYSPFVKLLLIVCIASFLLALGKNTPLFPFLYDNVPSFSLFQAPTRWTFLMVFCLSLLAAIGGELWQDRELLRLFWVRLGTVAAAASGIFALLGERVLNNLKESFTPAIALAGLWLTISGVIAWRRRIKPGRYWSVLITAFVAIDLLWAARGLNPSISLDVFRGKSKLVEQVSSDHRIFMPEDIEEMVKFEWSHRFDTFYPDIEWRLIRDTGLPNTPVLDRLPSVNNFDPILPERYVAWMKAVGNAVGEKSTELMEMMDIGWKVEFGSGHKYEIDYSPLMHPNRIYLVGEAVWVQEGGDALEIVLQPDFHPMDQVVLEGRSTNFEATDPSGSTFLILDENDPNKVDIKVTATSPCWLVLSDTWFPGWHATVNGERVDIYRANYLFKAVRLPNGEHRVEFTYHPTSFILGAGVSLFSWIVIGAFLWILKRR